MMLTPEEKASRVRDRMIEKAREYSIGTYINKFVAPVFQRMIRAEAGALPRGNFPAVVDGELTTVYRKEGQCVCVTCGAVKPWSSGLGGMHTGHFLGGRTGPILFDEGNVAPQCSNCNRYESGEPQKFRLWMESVRGIEEVERLKALKNTSRSFRRDELVDMRIEYQARLKAAEERMKGTT
jgi:hypothetical protein